MGIFKTLVDFFGGMAKVLTWFISAIVIPVIVWFMALRENVQSLQGSYEKTVMATQALRVEVDAMKAVHTVEKTRLEDQMVEIQRSLGKIEGELRRIR